ncbi:MAG: CNNM domain-containing protein [Fuerstiella sp.]
MGFAGSLFFAAFLFIVGLRLSAFFSGSETGFYRVSTLQLTLQKQRGDRVASSLFSFVANPEKFVATTLVGNNIANYITTLAVGMFVSVIWESSGGTIEIVATLLLTPVIFIFGELIPKSLFYRAPMSQLRAASRWFHLFYLLFLPVSLPLISASRLVTKLSKSTRRPLEVVFGRTRLFGVLEAGQREGILTQVQRNLAENLMQVAAQPVRSVIVPNAVLIGIDETASVDDALQRSAVSKSPFVLIHKAQQPGKWIGYVRVADVLSSALAPRLVMNDLPVFQGSTSRLEVMTCMFQEDVLYGLVEEDNECLGIIRRQTLQSELFRVMRPASSELTDLLTDSNS